jgi:glycosyltransferase involved in cell wall biosynthesis
VTPPRILLFGEAPPPYGGIQAHCTRLLAWLRQQGATVRLANTHSRGVAPSSVHDPDIVPSRNGVLPALRQIRAFQPDIVHLHVYRWRITALLGWLRQHPRAFGTAPLRTVVTIHGEAHFTTIPHLVRPLVHEALRHADVLIADNPMLLEHLHTEVGADPAHTRLIGAFLPPSPAELDPALLPADVLAFAAAHQPLIVGNGAVATFKDEDKYGVDLLLAAIAALRPEYPRIGAIFCITAVHDRARMQKLEAELAQRGLGDHFLFVQDLPSLAPLFAMADATVRATNTDGDALSVHESAMLGTPVLASDVVVRPAYADLFRNRDAADLKRVMRNVLARGRLDAGVTAQVAHAGAALWQLYESLLAKDISANH